MRRWGHWGVQSVADFGLELTEGSRGRHVVGVVRVVALLREASSSVSSLLLVHFHNCFRFSLFGFFERPRGRPTNTQPRSLNQPPTEQPTSRNNQTTKQKPKTTPTNQPTHQEKNRPAYQPTNRPTNLPTNQPTSQPANQPTKHATAGPDSGSVVCSRKKFSDRLTCST